MTEFDPISATVGGVLIGLGVAVLLLANHRVAGISGILGQAVWPAPGETRRWRVGFLLGLPVGAGIVSIFSGPIFSGVEAPPLLLGVAGLLVGFGTRLGNGCTSGHGVCGISRGSARSVVATLVFMAIGICTVFLTRHALGAS